MKLLIENHFGQTILESSTSNGKLYLEGPMVMCNAKNRNGRSYDLKTVGKPAVAEYNKSYVGEQRAIGELEHPEYPMPKITEAAVFIKDPLSWDGSNAIGKMEVLNNPKGQQIRALEEAGYRLGTSTRGLGEVNSRTGAVNPGYFITAVDVVDKPSGQVCYMDAITESVDWQLSNGVWTPTGVQGKRVDAMLKEAQGNPLLAAKIKAILNRL